MRVLAVLRAVLPYVLVSVVCYAVLQAYPLLRVSGGSMSPALQAGDVVVVNRTREVAEGDIALFKPDGRGMVLHRIIDVSASGITTKGDANDIADADRISEDDIQGIVAWVIPFGRAVQRWRAM